MSVQFDDAFAHIAIWLLLPFVIGGVLAIILAVVLG